MRPILSERKKSLQKAIEGLGQHGMVGTSDEKLMNLHDALKLEFEKVQRSYIEALEQLENLALVNSKQNSKKRSKQHTKQNSKKHSKQHTKQNSKQTIAWACA